MREGNREGAGIMCVGKRMDDKKAHKIRPTFSRRLYDTARSLTWVSDARVGAAGAEDCESKESDCCSGKEEEASSDGVGMVEKTCRLGELME